MDFNQDKLYDEVHKTIVYGPYLTVYLTNDEIRPPSYAYLYGMITTACIFLAISSYFSRRRSQRLLSEKKRWKDIKELEEDYDVYVTDEYAYHITDAKLQMQQIQELGIANLDMSEYNKKKKKMKGDKQIEGAAGGLF